MTDKEIMAMLQSPELSAVETAITSKCGSYVNREVIDFMVPSLSREIGNAGLTIDYIKQGIKSNKEWLIIFGIEMLKYHAGKLDKQEYPEGEEPEYLEQRAGEPQGMAIGFAYKYLMYLYFLENNRQSELLEFLKKERIPYAKDFRETLNTIYKKTTAILKSKH